MIRTPVGGGIRGGHYHSQSPEALFIHTPGLKVVMPSNPYDAKGLLLAAMRQDDPVIFMEPKRIYRAAKGEVPEGDYTVELGKARDRARRARSARVLAWSGMVSIAEEAASKAAEARHLARGHRPAHAVAVRHRHDPGVGREDRARA